MKTALCASGLAVALLAGQVCGASAQTMPNTVKNGDRGSVLVFPMINIDGDGKNSDPTDTFIEISNDQTSFGPNNQNGVYLKCIYVNEKKARDSFQVYISIGGSVSWDVRTREHDPTASFGGPNLFPSGGNFDPGPPFPPSHETRGELICIATDSTGTQAVAYNRLYGRATVMQTHLKDPPAEQPSQAIRYNAFTFRAWQNDLLATDYTVMASPDPVSGLVTLPLTGGAPNPLVAGLVYDACPSVNSTSFMPAGALTKLGIIRTVSNDVYGVGCNQDLSEPPFGFAIWTTELNFTVEDSTETPYDQSATCVDSVFSLHLGHTEDYGDQSKNDYLSQPQNFESPDAGGVVSGLDARLQVAGLQSVAYCSKGGGNNVAAGLLTVFTSDIVLTPHPPGIFDSIVANTNETVGAQVPPGVVGFPITAAGFITFSPGL